MKNCKKTKKECIDEARYGKCNVMETNDMGMGKSKKKTKGKTYRMGEENSKVVHEEKDLGVQYKTHYPQKAYK